MKLIKFKIKYKKKFTVEKFRVFITEDEVKVAIEIMWSFTIKNFMKYFTFLILHFKPAKVRNKIVQKDVKKLKVKRGIIRTLRSLIDKICEI